MSFAIPVKRLRETDNLMAFCHPRPTYPFHVLLVPKQAVASFLDLQPDSAFLTDLTDAVQSLVEEYQLPVWRLIINGGENEDFPQLHFDLISETEFPKS